MEREDRWNTAIEVWDYFCVRVWPRAGDEKTWPLIQNATCRIRESEQYMTPRWPADQRERHARRVRAAARAALRSIAKLSVAPPASILQGLVALERCGDELVQELRDEVRRIVLD